MGFNSLQIKNLPASLPHRRGRGGGSTVTSSKRAQGRLDSTAFPPDSARVKTASGRCGGFAASVSRKTRRGPPHSLAIEASSSKIAGASEKNDPYQRFELGPFRIRTCRCR